MAGYLSIASNGRRRTRVTLQGLSGGARDDHQSTRAGRSLKRKLDYTVPPPARQAVRDWTSDWSDAPREVCKLALAQVNTNNIEAAYRRTDLVKRRRVLMEQWAAFLVGTESAGAGLVG